MKGLHNYLLVYALQ